MLICYVYDWQCNFKIIQLNNDAVESFLQNNNIAYPNPFSINYPDEIIVPSIMKFDDNQIFYISYEGSEIRKTNDHSQTPKGIVTKLFSYNLKTKEKTDYGELNYEDLSSSDFLLFKENYYYFPLEIIAPDTVLNIKCKSLYNLENKTLEKILNGNINIATDYSDGIRIILINYSEKSKNEQRVYKILSEDNIVCIYDSIQMSSADKKYSALDIYDGNIYLLNQIIKENSLITSIDKMNFDGDILETFHLPIPNEYCDPTYYADQFYFFKNSCFIKWYHCGNELQFFTAYQLKFGKYRNINYSENSPCYLISRKPIAGRYLYFTTFPDNMNYFQNHYTSILKIFDIKTNKFIGVNIPLPNESEVTNIVCDEKGNLLITIQINRYDLYTEYDILKISGEDILSML